jgi:hypothetical protein
LLAFGLADVLVPPSHGEWLAANIPKAAVVVSVHGGHLPGDPVAEIADNMAWLRYGVAPTWKAADRRVLSCCGTGQGLCAGHRECP